MQMGFSNEDSCIKRDLQCQGCSSRLLPSRLGLYFLINGQVCVLAIDITQDLDIIQFDIKTIFLSVDLHEEIQYMCHLKGLIVYLERRKIIFTPHKSFYGLKQTSWQRNMKFNEFLVSYKIGVHYLIGFGIKVST